jgi:hypothetical protein
MTAHEGQLYIMKDKASQGCVILASLLLIKATIGVL